MGGRYKFINEISCGVTSPQHSAAPKPLSSGPWSMVGTVSGWVEAWHRVLQSEEGSGSMKA